MEWILFVNAQHETTYQYIYGDKDSFELAFNLADKGKQYNRVKYGPRASFRPLEVLSTPPPPTCMILCLHTVADAKAIIQ